MVKRQISRFSQSMMIAKILFLVDSTRLPHSGAQVVFLFSVRNGRISIFWPCAIRNFLLREWYFIFVVILYIVRPTVPRPLLAIFFIKSLCCSLKFLLYHYRVSTIKKRFFDWMIFSYTARRHYTTTTTRTTNDVDSYSNAVQYEISLSLFGSYLLPIPSFFFVPVEPIVFPDKAALLRLKGIWDFFW